MKILTALIALTVVASVACADDVSDSDRMLCSQSRVLVCVQGVDCVAVDPAKVSTPQFVIVDTRRKTVSTTKASGDDRISEFTSLIREGGLVIAQGRADERSFSFVIDERTGTLTGSTVSDGYTLSSFGACTDAAAK
jgi:hypothetical protein